MQKQWGYKSFVGIKLNMCPTTSTGSFSIAHETLFSWNGPIYMKTKRVSYKYIKYKSKHQPLRSSHYTVCVYRLLPSLSSLLVLSSQSSCIPCKLECFCLWQGGAARIVESAAALLPPLSSSRDGNSKGARVGANYPDC